MEVAREGEARVVARVGQVKVVVTDRAPDLLATVSARVVGTKYHMCQDSAVVTVTVPSVGQR